MKRIVGLFVLYLFVRSSVFAQTTLINPATQGGFESGNTFAANGWTVVNGTQTNRWFCNTPNPATPFAGTRCAYISNNASGTTYNYSITNSSVVHFYRDITIPAGEPYLTLSFRWKGQAESCCDYIRVHNVSTATTPVAGSLLSTGQLSGNLNNVGSTWTLATFNICATPGTTIRLVFSWINDGSIGTQPPGAIDNISLVSNSTIPPCNLGTGVTTVASLPYASGAGTTCGAVNDLTSSNTVTCGSPSYLGGEDRVWIFTPTTSGMVNINLTSSGSWNGLMLYDGCPLTGMCTSSGQATCCISSAQSSSGNKSISFCATAGVTYYLILDVFPSPSCNPYTNLTISAPSGTSCSNNQECIKGITVCSNASFSGASSGIGCSQELNASNQGCLTGGERQSAWYLFSPSASGNIGLTIAPGANTDYDFAIWGPFPPGSTAASICPPSSSPIRCSFAAASTTFSQTGSYNTGIGHATYSVPQFAPPTPAHTDGSGNTLNGWVPGLQVTAGQVYVLMIDNFTADGTPFNLNWDLSGGASLNCTVLPIELLNFNVKNLGYENLIYWNSISEINSDLFVIERISNEENEFYEIGKMKAMGNSNIQVDYSFIDRKPNYGYNYYRLKMIDFDGTFKYSEIVAIRNLFDANFAIKNIFPNPTTNDFNIDIVTNTNEDLVITLTDVYGKKLNQFEYSVVNGDNTIKINTDKIEKGLIFVNITSPKNSNINITQKIVKQ